MKLLEVVFRPWNRVFLLRDGFRRGYFRSEVRSTDTFIAALFHRSQFFVSIFQVLGHWILSLAASSLHLAVSDEPMPVPIYRSISYEDMGVDWPMMTDRLRDLCTAGSILHQIHLG